MPWRWDSEGRRGEKRCLIIISIIFQRTRCKNRGSSQFGAVLDFDGNIDAAMMHSQCSLSVKFVDWIRLLSAIRLHQSDFPFILTFVLLAHTLVSFSLQTRSPS